MAAAVFVTSYPAIAQSDEDALADFSLEMEEGNNSQVNVNQLDVDELEEVEVEVEEDKLSSPPSDNLTPVIDTVDNVENELAVQNIPYSVL